MSNTSWAKCFQESRNDITNIKATGTYCYQFWKWQQKKPCDHFTVKHVSSSFNPLLSFSGCFGWGQVWLHSCWCPHFRLYLLFLISGPFSFSSFQVFLPFLISSPPSFSDQSNLCHHSNCKSKIGWTITKKNNQSFVQKSMWSFQLWEQNKTTDDNKKQ